MYLGQKLQMAKTPQEQQQIQAQIQVLQMKIQRLESQIANAGESGAGSMGQKAKAPESNFQARKPRMYPSQGGPARPGY